MARGHMMNISPSSVSTTRQGNERGDPPRHVID
jgi:hypothetical protein